MMTMMVRNDGGEIAVDVEGEGSLVLCIPGMGESRTSFRHLVPRLVSDGYRVAAMDLRGHGDSSVSFAAYDDEATSRDALAVIDALGGGPAVIAGNSMGAAAAVLVATASPQAVSALVLLGPAVRDGGSTLQRIFLRAALVRPWGPLFWKTFYRSLFGPERPADHDEHIALADRLLRRPGRWRAFAATTRTSHASSAAALSAVTVPTLIIMGSDDPDFPDPAAEAREIAVPLRAQVLLIEGARHYPMAERPDLVHAAMRDFLRQDVSHG